MKKNINTLLYAFVLVGMFTCAKGMRPPEPCGNGILDPEEACDDGNRVNGDGCSSDCRVESGYACTGEPSICAFTCGNGRLDPGEECDDGGESATCNTNCTFSRCGDGIWNTTAGESCDDGGPSDFCNADCTIVGCGDGVLNTARGEQCDDGGESATCNADCTFAVCGDGKLNETAGEECDDRVESADCNADCTIAMCGDGYINIAAGEQCDDEGESATCNADCTGAACGDGKLNVTAGEQCDDGGESTICNSNCTHSTCGDGIVNPTAGEQCDDGGESATCNGNCTQSICGDGIVNTTAGEQCDDGGESVDCNANCTWKYVCSNPLEVTYQQNNGWSGNMFDVVARRNITVTGFSGAFYTGSQTVDVYYRYGTHVGFTGSTSGWTHLGTVNVTGMGAGNPTNIPLTFSVPVADGQRVAFYVTCRRGYQDGNYYLNGSATGTLYKSNPELHVYVGTGTQYPLGTAFVDRVFNGTIRYNCN